MYDISKLKNEEGSVLIVALIVLVLLTLLSIFATRTTEVEIQIAGNDMRYKRNIYSAEAVAMEAAQNIKDTGDLDTAILPWLHGMGGVVRANVLDDAYWDANSQQSIEDANTRYMAVVEGIAGQTSLDMTKSRIHVYSIYGRRYNTANTNEGRSIVNIGFKKAL